jgi:competence protein ComEA
MEELSPKQWIIAIILVGLIAFGAGNLTGIKTASRKIRVKPQNELQIQTPVQSKTAVPQKPEEIIVYVTGEVNKPDVYKLKEGSIVKDAITKAGGATKDADLIAINLAKRVSDGEEIIVPKKGAQNKSAANLAPAPSEKDGKININTADLATLEKLPGIGEVKANAIIQYRKEHNGFKTIHEITRVSGIGEKTFEKIRDLITVG